MAESASNASRDQNERALTVLPLFGVWLGVLESAEFLLRVDLFFWCLRGLYLFFHFRDFFFLLF